MKHLPLLISSFSALVALACGGTSESNRSASSDTATDTTATSETTAPTTSAGGDTTTTGTEACGEFVACGGDPTGTWTIEAMCMDVAALYEGLDLPEACDTLFASHSLTPTGTLTFQGGEQSSLAGFTQQVHAVYTPACVAAIQPAAAPLDAAVCSRLEAQLQSDPQGTAACSWAAPNCDCNYTQVTTPEASSTTYRVVGNTIILADGTTLEFCVAGDTLTLSDPTAAGGMLIKTSRAP